MPFHLPTISRAAYEATKDAWVLYTSIDVFECKEMLSDEARDECETGFAFKQKDPSLCANVGDEKHRKYCEIRINTWLNYPQLHSSFYFGTPVPVD